MCSVNTSNNRAVLSPNGLTLPSPPAKLRSSWSTRSDLGRVGHVGLPPHVAARLPCVSVCQGCLSLLVGAAGSARRQAWTASA
jgi:hypothetical protein